MNRDIALGLVGAGRWGKIFIRSLAEMDGLRLAGLASRNPQSPALAPPACPIVDDWRHLIDGGGLDGLIIATPPTSQPEIARAAINAGLPVLAEKPLAVDLAEAKSILDLACSRSVLVMVDHTHLFSPAYRSLKQQLESMGGGAAISSISARAGNRGPFRSDTPVLWDWGPHDLAMVLDLFQNRPIKVTARRTRREMTAEGLGEEIELELLFPDDRRAFILLSNLMERKELHLSVECATRALIYDDVGPDKLLVRDPPDAAPRPIKVPNLAPVSMAVGEFAQSIRAGGCDLAGLELAVDVVELLEQCERSL
ncbi:MAG: Gfo/Idh/MocA family oxidoreductase [Rhodospirillales bacterium]|nr:Gfo/Idh/MocA family oxidoreductase [Rhodospirillales bacterium]